MMFHLTPNFFSIVCVGKFNPSILSIDFIKRHCQYSFKGNPQQKNTPVASTIENGDISILVEFSKFQVVRERYDLESAGEAISLAIKYLQVLEYTPINKLGINFNYEVSSFEQEKINQAFYDHIKSVGLGLSDSIGMTSTLTYDKGNAIRIRGLELYFKTADHFKCRADLNNLRTNMVLNINFEVDELENNRSHLEKIEENFSMLNDLQDNLILRLFHEYK